MTLDEKIGQLVQRAGGRSKALNSRLDDAELDRVRAGVGGLLSARRRRGTARQAAEGRHRGIAARHPAAVRHGRGPRLPHDLPGPARDGVELGARERRTRRAHRRRGSHLRRACTGPSRPWSTSRATRAGAASSKARAKTLPRLAHGGRPGRGIPGRQRAAPGLAHGHGQALRRLRRRDRRPRLQQRGHLRAHAAGSLSTAVLRRGARGRGLLHGRVQRHRRRADDREPRSAARHAARALGLAGPDGLRLGLDRRAAHPRRRGGSRDRRRRSRSMRRSTWTWWAASTPTI